VTANYTQRRRRRRGDCAYSMPVQTRNTLYKFLSFKDGGIMYMPRKLQSVATYTSIILTAAKVKNR
jgi:hypothetical protein